MILVDTCILLDVLADDPAWAVWSQTQLERWAAVGTLAIDPVVYAELAAGVDSIEELDAIVAGFDLKLVEPKREALFLAGQAFAAYRRRGGTRRAVLADFFIGAHAAALGVPVLTRDTRRYRSLFPRLVLIAP